MILFGLHETALIALICIAVLLYPRILPRLSQRFGTWRATRQEVDDTPVDTAVHVYDTMSPVVNTTGSPDKKMVLRQLSKTLKNR